MSLVNQHFYNLIINHLNRMEKRMSDKIDALVAADTALALAVHDALDKIAQAVQAVNVAAADEVAITDATATITAQVDALRAVVPVV